MTEKKISISNLPVRITTIIVIFFGIVPSLVYYVYIYRSGFREMETFRKTQQERLEKELALQVESVLEYLKNTGQRQNTDLNSSMDNLGELLNSKNANLRTQQFKEKEVFFILDSKMKILAKSEDDKTLNPDIQTIVNGMNRQILLSPGESALYPHDADKSVSSAQMIVFAKTYQPNNWTVAAAAGLEPYLKEAEEEYKLYKQEVLGDILFEIVILVTAVIAVVFVGRTYGRQLNRNLSEFEAFFRKASQGREQIDLEKVKFSELKDLGELANKMVAQRAEAQEAIEKLNIELMDSNRKLEELANLDGLTGIANRRYFNNRLKSEWARAARNQTPLTIGMMDIDHFKSYNDTYGHQEGDNCLKEFANVLNTSLLRPSDLVARYGGEEFVFLLPHTPLDGGKEIGERIRQGVSELNIPHKSVPLGRVSFSMGLSCQVPNSSGSDPDDLIKKADEALYRAKENGRNRIESDPEE